MILSLLQENGDFVGANRVCRKRLTAQMLSFLSSLLVLDLLSDGVDVDSDCPHFRVENATLTRQFLIPSPFDGGLLLLIEGKIEFIHFALILMLSCSSFK